MSKITEAVAADVAAIKESHPALYGVLEALADAFASAEVDPDSALATPAAALVSAFDASGEIG